MLTFIFVDETGGGVCVASDLPKIIEPDVGEKDEGHV